VQNCEVYRSGKQKQSREFSRNWGKKNFYRWIREFTTVFANSDQKEYILSHRCADGEGMDVVDEGMDLATAVAMGAVELVET